VIELFNINNHIIDTSEFSNLLHDDIVVEFEKKIADYVGAKYACSVNSATNAIYLSLLNKDVTVNLPSIIPPVVANAILTSGNYIEFIDNVNWVGNSYVLYEFSDYKIIDSAQKLKKNQFKKECNPQDLMIFSFYPTKPLGGSDGGMIVTDDYEKYKWFKEAVLNGTTYSDDSWGRDISFPGYKMYMNSIQAKILLNNFKFFNKKMRVLKKLVNTYNEEFGYNNTSQHLYRIEVVNNEKFIRNMKNVGILCGIHYSALHSNPIYTNNNCGYENIHFDCPKSEKIQKRTVSLPMNETLSFLELEYIIDKVKELS
jgi:dTDP-4-amino-4,6-dideoxygalactose transaminase|tara:strand:+ start:96 stop:1034 length:939 start_codon:yes stop_codon:yes gene_type:complete